MQHCWKIRRALLTDILTYHVVDGVVLAETVVTLDSADTLQRRSRLQSWLLTMASSSTTASTSVATDIKATNGVIHVIDAVLLPPADEMMEEPTQSIAEIAAGNEDFSTLVAALSAAELVETLDGEGEFTVFAPTNEAFDALPDGTVEALLADPQGALTEILLYHVVAGIVTAEQVVELTEAPTLFEGHEITIEVTEDGVLLEWHSVSHDD